MDRLIDLTIQTRLSSMGNYEFGITDEPFFVADLGQVLRQHRRWQLNFPDVHAFYGMYGTSSIESIRSCATRPKLTIDAPAVKCNPDTTLLRLLAELGTGFDCASTEELRVVLNLGVDPSRIIFANPCKSASSLLFAARMGVTLTTFDNLDELETIQTFLPTARLVLRIYACDNDAIIMLGEKFGAPLECSFFLLQRAQELGLEVCGVSFHVGKFSSGASSLHIIDIKQRYGGSERFSICERHSTCPHGI